MKSHYFSPLHFRMIGADELSKFRDSVLFSNLYFIHLFIVVRDMLSQIYVSRLLVQMGVIDKRKYTLFILRKIERFEKIGQIY